MDLSELERTPDRMWSRWLTDCLSNNGHLSRGDVASVDIKAAHKHHFALEVAYSEDASHTLPQRFILKWYRPEYPYNTGERLFYEQVASEMPAPPVPFCYGVDTDTESGQTYILLEDLSPTHYVASSPYDNLNREMFEQVMQAHLVMHAFWWDHPRISRPDILRDGGTGVAHEAISAKTIRKNQRHFAEEALPGRVDQSGEQFEKPWRALCERVIASWADLFIERISGETGLTLLQGDAQLGNMMLPRDPRRHQPVIIDWEGCTRGIGVWDLARTMVQTELPSDQRKALEEVLLTAYQTQLTEHGIAHYSLEDCIADYRLCVLSNIPHALVWETHSYLVSAIRAFRDWDCEDLLN